MKVMRRPRTFSSRVARGIAMRSSPAKRIVPPAKRAFLATVPRIELASVVLPQPDSPTSPMISPGFISKLTPSSTRASPAAVANERKRLSTSSSLSPGTSDPRIEHVAQAVAEEVEPHHDEEDGEPGRKRVPPRLRKEFARLRDHASPFRRRRRRAEPQEPERARSQNREAHADRRAHDD